ncbi:MAG: Uma2 family endonuclease [Eubacterium sp.]|nr:Uma2 family endonuclease [Eubacterium sp.]
MLLSTMKDLKKLYGLSYKEISEKSGVSMGTVQKVFGGITSPRAKTLEELSKAFIDLDYPDIVAEHSRYSSGTSARKLKGSSNNEFEKLIPGKKNGEYTIYDYEKLPEDLRAELIDGSLYKMEAPSNIHQTIILELAMQLKNSIKKRKGSCKVFISPSDVELSEDEPTIVQPDLYIVCNKDMSKDSKRTHGAPDFIAEVISMSTRIKDKRLKHYKYANAGVREYWIIDPFHESVTTYNFEDDDMVSIYTFDDSIPLAIYNGVIKVDFSEIKDELISTFGSAKESNP